MNYKKRFLEICEFLLPYQNIWQNEIMLCYPTPLESYPEEWIDELTKIKIKEDIIRLEKKEVFDYIKSASLIDFYRRIEELCEIPWVEELPAIPETPFTFLFMIPKKQHEIRKLSPYIYAFAKKHFIDRIIDIGGGIGLLAQTLTNEYNLKVTSLDMDPVLQETGKVRHEKNARHKDNKVEYLNVKVDEHDLRFHEILRENSMSLGLHTCGSLANAQIKMCAIKKIKGMINFGCCYIKLEHDPTGQNISKFAKSLPEKIEMNHFALTLSCRAHRKMNEKDYDLKQKVKLYRYAIHMLLHDHYGYKNLITLGNSTPKLYNESFGTYVLEQFNRVNITPKHTKEDLDHYFKDAHRQKLLWDMITGGLIRNALGRLLELYILFDRVIYLEENGYKADLYQFFDEETSPRNLGIVASLKQV